MADYIDVAAIVLQTHREKIMSKSSNFGWAVPQSRRFGWMTAVIVTSMIWWGSDPHFSWRGIG